MRGSDELNDSSMRYIYFEHLIYVENCPAWGIKRPFCCTGQAFMGVVLDQYGYHPYKLFSAHSSIGDRHQQARYALPSHVATWFGVIDVNPQPGFDGECQIVFNPVLSE